MPRRDTAAGTIHGQMLAVGWGRKVWGLVVGGAPGTSLHLCSATPSRLVGMAHWTGWGRGQVSGEGSLALGKPSAPPPPVSWPGLPWGPELSGAEGWGSGPFLLFQTRASWCVLEAVLPGSVHTAVFQHSSGRPVQAAV